MGESTFVAQLRAMRAGAAAIVAQADALLSAAEEPAPVGCPAGLHPSDKVLDVSTMGDSRERCTVCSEEWPVVTETEE